MIFNGTICIDILICSIFTFCYNIDHNHAGAIHGMTVAA